MHLVVIELTLCCYRWFYIKVAEDLRFLTKDAMHHTMTLKILTGGSSADELVPNSELSRNSCLHESVHVWLNGILELAAQKQILSCLKEEKHISLALDVTRQQIEQISDHLIAITDSSSKKLH
jgi:hypothetical protein